MSRQPISSAADTARSVSSSDNPATPDVYKRQALTNLLLPRVRSQIINVGSDAHRTAKLRLDDMHLRNNKWTRLGAYAVSKLAVMLWGLELDRRLRAAGSPVVTQLTHPGWVASNLSQISDSPLMSLAHKTVKAVGDRFANDADQGAAPT